MGSGGVDGVPILEARSVTKRFPGVLALDEVDAVFSAGEIVAVMGENGAGKSTLMKVLAGIYPPDGGHVIVDGSVTEIDSVRRASELGIAFIHQELNLADNLSAAANLFLGREKTRFGFARVLDDGEHQRRAAELFERLGLDVSPLTKVSELSIGHQQMVEIAKALSQDARILIMDEPTSSLTKHETDRLMEIVRELRDSGMCVVFISHRLAEVQDLADRVIVLRDGKNSGNLVKGEIERDRIVSLMVGRDLEIAHKAAAGEAGDCVLHVSGLRTQRFPQHEVGFEVRAGEIVGIAGLIGAGRSEVLRAIFGIDRRKAGQVEVGGVVVQEGSVRGAINAGLALVPEDRKAEGVVVELMMRDNVALPGMGGFLKRKIQVDDSRIDSAAETVRAEMGVKVSAIEQTLATLSGGNQQKVAIGKWSRLKPAVFLLDEPTRGIDIRSRGEIYEAMETMASDGAGLLVASSDLEEILRISDRVLVMCEGVLAGVLSRSELSEERVMEFATGGN